MALFAIVKDTKNSTIYQPIFWRTKMISGFSRLSHFKTSFARASDWKFSGHACMPVQGSLGWVRLKTLFLFPSVFPLDIITNQASVNKTKTENKSPPRKEKVKCPSCCLNFTAITKEYFFFNSLFPLSCGHCHY